MNYLSTKEIAEIWDLTPRRVTVLASGGRIPGAKLVGKTWLIPESAQKPVDGRYKNIKSEKKGFFPLFGFLYNSYETASKELTDMQLLLFKGQNLCITGDYIEADKILTNILNSTDDVCFILGAVYFKIYIDIFQNNIDSIMMMYQKIQRLNIEHIEKKGRTVTYYSGHKRYSNRK